MDTDFRKHFLNCGDLAAIADDQLGPLAPSRTSWCISPSCSGSKDQLILGKLIVSLCSDLFIYVIPP